MAIQFDGSNLSESDFNDDYQLVEPGQFICRVARVDDSLEDYKSSVVVDFKILGPADDRQPAKQEGLVHREFLSISPKARIRIAKFCEAVGWSRSDLTGESVLLELKQALGRDLIITIVDHEYTDDKGDQREGRQISFKGFKRLESAVAQATSDDSDPYADL